MDIDSFIPLAVIGENTAWQIVGLFLLILIGLIAGKLLKYLLNKRAEQLSEKRPITASALLGVARSAPFLAFTLGLFSGVSLIDLGPAEDFVTTSVSVLFTVAVAATVFFLVDAPSLWLVRRASGTPSKMDDMLAPIISKSLKATVVVLAIVQIAQILSGKEVTSILAGLGIGGLAFALAAQDTIKNFFGSMVLLADKPFEIGDRINIDGHDGPVEEVGLRSTRIRTLDGHLVTIPNGEMANKTIWNIAKRPYIRRLFNIGITYGTPPEKVREAKAILEELMKEHEGMDPEFPPRVYFNNFESSSLNLLCIYWYHPPAYWDFMDFTEQLNLQILERFNTAGIDFAFPTQTIHLAKPEETDLLNQA